MSHNVPEAQPEPAPDDAIDLPGTPGESTPDNLPESPLAPAIPAQPPLVPQPPVIKPSAARGPRLEIT